jgi:hypothetical protein
VIAALAVAALLLGAAVRAHAVLPALAALAAGAGAFFSWPASLAGSALGALLLVLGGVVWRLLDDAG